jgi:NTE family protein
MSLIHRVGHALCLSGGGYRAMLFHTGALWRLNELSFLRQLDYIGSASGGAIAAGMLGMNFRHLDFDHGGRALNFHDAIVTHIRRLASRTIDIPALILGPVRPGATGNRLVAAYRKHLFADATLAMLPDRPTSAFYLDECTVRDECHVCS